MKEIVEELKGKLKDMEKVRTTCAQRICEIEEEMRLLISQKNGSLVDGRRQANGLCSDAYIDVEEFNEKLDRLDKERSKLKKKINRLNTGEMIEQINKYKN